MQNRTGFFNSSEKLKEAFCLVDYDADSKIGFEDLKQLFLDLDDVKTDQEIRQMISSVDTSGTGFVSPKDFCELMKFEEYK